MIYEQTGHKLGVWVPLHIAGGYIYTQPEDTFTHSRMIGAPPIDRRQQAHLQRQSARLAEVAHDADCHRVEAVGVAHQLASRLLAAQTVFEAEQAVVLVRQRATEEVVVLLGAQGAIHGG